MLLLKKEKSAFDFSEILKDHVDLLCFSLYVRMGGSSGGEGVNSPPLENRKWLWLFLDILVWTPHEKL